VLSVLNFAYDQDIIACYQERVRPGHFKMYKYLSQTRVQTRESINRIVAPCIFVESLQFFNQRMQKGNGLCNVIASYAACAYRKGN